MTELLRRFEESGHRFSIEGGQVKVVSNLAKLDQREIDWLRSNKGKIINLLLAREFSEAFERIEAVYSPTLSFEGNADVRRRELDRMELCSLETIAAWEAGWLKLIDELNKNQGVNRTNNLTPKKAWPHVG